MRKFEWAVVGSGIAGIVIAEILTREGHNVVLIERNEKLASETTRDFHEWIHTGSLYTLIPDNLTTLKFLLGAIDDLLEYYGSFKNMNLFPTDRGLVINDSENGWFSNNKIHFKFRIKGRKLTFPWILGIARAIFLIEQIKKHDWLRQRAGITDPFKLKYDQLLNIFLKLVNHNGIFYDYTTSDFTTNSRELINDLLNYSIQNGLVISNQNEFLGYTKDKNHICVNCVNESFEVEKVVLCIGGNIAKYFDASVKLSYAPIAVVSNISSEINSFVELDYYPKNCINIITKKNGIGLIGGISFSDINKCDGYIKEVIRKHSYYSPNLKVLHTYNGIKSEILIKNKSRNYLYHILNNNENVWGIIPGKFTLGFSIAPEFYRRVYSKNPKKYITDNNYGQKLYKNLSNTVWEDEYLKSLNNQSYGND